MPSRPHRRPAAERLPLFERYFLTFALPPGVDNLVADPTVWRCCELALAAREARG